MSASARHILQRALPLIPTHGFTRAALAHAAPHTPLSEGAVSALFGAGDGARRALIGAWLDAGRAHMRRAAPAKSVGDALGARLEYNRPVLPLLPEAFALLASPSAGLPPLDVRPALRHAAGVADEACHVVGEAHTGYDWYTRRASLAAVYAAAELHQISSPDTARAFLDSLLASSAAAAGAADEAGLFAGFVLKSWKGIIRSSGVF